MTDEELHNPYEFLLDNIKRKILNLSQLPVRKNMSGSVNELSSVMSKDFKDWWQNSEEEWPEIAAAVITDRRESEETAWQLIRRTVNVGRSL